MARINIIGAGLAGLSAALSLAEKDIPCRMISAQPSERAQSVLAEGGIIEALDTMDEHDSPEEHFEDTMRGGCYLADPNAVEGLTRNAPHIIEQLRALGNLMPRDVIAREMYFVRRQSDTDGEVMLDMTGLPGEIWKNRLADLRRQLIYYLGRDPVREPVAVREGIHYFMGGIDTELLLVNSNAALLWKRCFGRVRK